MPRVLYCPCTPSPASLPLRTSANVAWTSILAYREEIYDEWIARVGGRWDAKIQERLAKKQVPNLLNGASGYRDDEPEMVYRSVALWVHFLPELKRRLSDKDFLVKKAEFRRGALDDDLLPLCTVMDKNVKVTDIRFVSETAVEQFSSHKSHEESVDDAQRAAALAAFNLFYTTLRSEQSAWRRYVGAARAYSASHESETVSYQEKLEEEYIKAVESHMATHYLIQGCPTLRECCVFANTALQSFADVSPPVSATSILRLSVWNLPMMGQKMSLSYADFQREIRSEITAHPETACALIILPNAPAYGAGNCSGVQYMMAVQKNKEKYIALVRSADPERIVAMEGGGVFNDVTMYSTERDLRVEFMICFSSLTTVAEGKAGCTTAPPQEFCAHSQQFSSSADQLRVII